MSGAYANCSANWSRPLTAVAPASGGACRIGGHDCRGDLVAPQRERCGTGRPEDWQPNLLEGLDGRGWWDSLAEQGNVIHLHLRFERHRLAGEAAVFDRQATLARVGQDLALLREAIGLFLVDNETQLIQMRSALAAGDTEQLRRVGMASRDSYCFSGAGDRRDVGPAPPLCCRQRNELGHDGVGHAGTAIAHPPATTPHLRRGSHSMKVLIAEDDALYRRVLQATLAEWGYKAETVTEGNAALAALTAPNGPPMAILDWIMPGLEGIDVCRRLRTRPSSTPIYVIVLTARDAKEDLVAGLESGADDYLTKPFNREELRRLIVGQRHVELQHRLAERPRTGSGAAAGQTTPRIVADLLLLQENPRRSQLLAASGDVHQRHSDTRFSHGICPECFETVVKPELARLQALPAEEETDPPTP